MNSKYGLSIRLSERTKNISIVDRKFIKTEQEKIVSHCEQNNIILNSSNKIKETSVINQIWEGIKYAKENSLTIYKIYVDLYMSGGSWERKELLEMLNDFDLKLINGFIFKDLKRFSRDVILQETILNEYKTIKGADFRLVHDQEKLNNEFDRKLDAILNERIIIEGRKHAKRIFKQKIEKGLPCFHAPFGYKNKNKTWVIDKKKYKIVQQINNRYKNENWNYLCKEFKISKSIYYSILKHIKLNNYSGKTITYIKKKKDLKGKVVNKEKITYNADYEPIFPSQ